jgi:hypothetical protein
MTYHQGPGGLYLRCRSAQHGDGRCPEPANCPAGPLEQFVWERFEDEYLGDGRAEAIEANDQVAAARERLSAARARSKNAMSLYTLVASDSERELAAEQVKAAGRELQDAEAELAEAQARARGSRLPTRLTLDEAREAPLSERRHWLSLAYAAVAVRKARGWREPVADRARIILADDAPGNGTALRGFVAAQAD